MKKITFTILLMMLAYISYSQTSSGNAYYIDYESWSTGGVMPPEYINCGNNNLFNTGNELTIEAWFRSYDAGWNTKILGKMSNTLNNGYVMGQYLLMNYAEVFTPDHYEIQAGSIPLDSAWIHFATTYKAGEKMKCYVNGILVGETAVSANPIASNNEPFIIGVAPWDIHALQYFGHIDEVRIWNVARTIDQINNTIYKRLNGNETGLVAYYDFDVTSGNTLPDKSINGNNGTVMATEYWWWATSYAPVGDSTMKNMNDIAAFWCGKNPTIGHVASTQKGLTMIGKISNMQPEYGLFGHNNATGITTDNIPAGFPSGFQRTAREWYVNKGGEVNADFLFDLNNAAGGSTALPSDKDVSFYTLLTRNNTSENFTAVSCANSKAGSIITFKNAQLENKYYAIGVGDANIAPPSQINESNKNTTIKIFPNPAKDNICINNPTHLDLEISIFNINGKSCITHSGNDDVLNINVKNLAKGIYLIRTNNHIDRSYCYEKIYITE